METLDPRDVQLIEAVVSAVSGLIAAHARVDHTEIAEQVARLLGAVAKYSNALAERPSDAPLRRAVGTLSR